MEKIFHEYSTSFFVFLFSGIFVNEQLRTPEITEFVEFSDIMKALVDA